MSESTVNPTALPTKEDMERLDKTTRILLDFLAIKLDHPQTSYLVDRRRLEVIRYQLHELTQALHTFNAAANSINDIRPASTL